MNHQNNQFDVAPFRANAFCFMEVISIILLPLMIGLILLNGPIHRNSATYDEVTYYRLAIDWWKTGADESITRMGSPVTFWKWQSLPALIWLDWSGEFNDLHEPLDQLPSLLPVFRLSALWIWGLGLWASQYWAWRLNGHKAALFTGICYASGPNLLAHGSLITMECPLWVFWTLSFIGISNFISKRSRKSLALGSIFAGIAFSMKFTAVLIPFLFLAILWIKESLESSGNLLKCEFKFWIRSLIKSCGTFAIFTMLMIVTNLVVTGFATIPLSEQKGEHPWLLKIFTPEIASHLASLLEMSIPVDWAGFLTQLRHQSSGGPGYLFGEISNSGWRWYYLVALSVKVPVAILAAILLRPVLIRTIRKPEDWLIPAVSIIFLAVACAGSKRNYGFRYLLPVAPMMIVWLSGLVRTNPGRIAAVMIVASLGLNTFRTHPWELTYFNEFVGGPELGRRILADSNLDWGQGLLQLREMQCTRPELNSLTLFYFGDVAPSVYEISGMTFQVDASDRFEHLPKTLAGLNSQYVAVSTSLSDGPWGPSEYFRIFREIKPVTTTPDGSIRIYELDVVIASLKK
jgi:hypothetical protein